MNRNLLLLTLCQGLFLTNNVVFIAINGLVGLSLAPRGWMATLPVTGYVVGAALSTMLVARLQRRLGRKRSFQIGLVVAACTAALCALAVSRGEFWWLVAATVVAGFYSANASLYRFAGPELAAPAFKERAISLVLAGGIVGAFAGPNLASATRNLLPVPFAAAYLSLVGSRCCRCWHCRSSASRRMWRRCPAPAAGAHCARSLVSRCSRWRWPRQRWAMA